MSVSEVKQKRGRQLGALTRLRRQAFVLIDGRGSRSSLASILSDLNTALGKLEELNDAYSDLITPEEEKREAQLYFTSAENQYEEAVTRIEDYLRSRKGEPSSVVSYQRSHASAGSSTSKQAEIAAQVKKLELAQLEHRLEMERQEQQMKQDRELQEARDAAAAADLEARLTKAAEDALSWERKDDFRHEVEAQADKEPGKMERCVNPNSNSNVVFRQSLPKLSVPTFSGQTEDWPRWYSLFCTLVHHQQISDHEKMAHLQNAVTGAARSAIGGFVCDGSTYQDAMLALKERYGRDADVVQAALKTVFTCTSPKQFDAKSLEKYYNAVHCATSTLQNMGYDGDLQSFENLRRLVSKLPIELRKAWAEHSLKLQRPSLTHFDEWLRDEVRVLLICESTAPTTTPPKRSAGVFATQAAGVATTRVCALCGGDHGLWQCDRFKAMSEDERARVVAENRLCFSCLRPGHQSRACRTARACGIDGCLLKHNRLLHGSRRVRSLNPLAAPTPGPVTREATIASTITSPSHSVLLQVVPVRIHGPDGRVKDTLALLDPGAQTSLCDLSVLEELNVTGETQPLRLNNVEAAGQEKMSRRVKLELSPLAGTEDPTKRICVPEVFSVDRVNVRAPVLRDKELRNMKHLKGLVIPDLSGREVQLLLGANVLEAVLQREARVGGPGEPVAIRTAFGWSLTGSLASLVPQHHREVMFVQRADEELTNSLQDWWSTETFGCKIVEEQLSPGNAKAMKILEDTTRRVGDNYEVGLPWRDERTEMPDNRKMASKRLASLEHSLRRNSEKAQSYAEVIEGYVEQGYARKISPEEEKIKEKKRWLLPHHAVVHPDKPKPRVVFDAAAELDGVSLNTELLTGPDLLQNLAGVLLRFREEQHALVADIYQMFHQIRVRPQDQPALSFLWRGVDSNKPPDIYQMGVVIFGARCSPTIANHILRRALTENPGTGGTEVERDSLVSSFYMDDYLRSEASVEEAGAARREVTTLLRQGGFRLTKWRSNSPELLEGIKEEDRDASQKSITMSKSQTQKALGCVWSPSADTLSVRVREAEVASTKRGVLQRTAMLFDPLGIIVPFLLIAKCLIQTLWQKRLAWDDDLPGEDLRTWNHWLEELTYLEELTVPRCLRSGLTEEVHSVELHLFADASERAFAAAGYVRFEVAAGRHHSSLVMARSRLAPLKQLSIVRLELQAAVLAVRLANTIKKEMSYVFSRTVFWTDSQVVLQFISNESRTFRTFVANRVAEIHESSELSDWKHVPGKQNPADIASRGMSASQLKNCNLWWTGPEFLRKDEDEWPKTEIAGLHPEQPELKKSSVKPTVTFVGDSSEVKLADPACYSSWCKYRRVVAWCLRFISNIRSVTEKKPKQSGALSVDELKKAELLILREDQERRVLETPTGLSLFRDDQGLVRTRGRLGSAPLAEMSREPIAMHPSSDVTRLIVSDLHARSMHAGTSQTLNQFRYRFWTPKARSTVKKILRGCAVCRNRRALPVCPEMAALPKVRVEMDRPFANCGLDFLGPLTVKKFRKTEKRYILLLTCLATRAVHLEIAQGLDTDSFLLALRRFIGRRGKPRCICSDNGTNLVGGERELREALAEWNQQKISETLSQEDIIWKFNPPTASHMGGAWERLVASVKRALRAVLGNQTVSDEVLHTTVVEVEYVINSRPLTYVSGANSDPESITPNHFLLAGPPASTSGLPPGVFEDGDTTRRRWRHVQVLTNQVWRRWLREYLPTLISRGKWNQERPNLSVGDVVLVMAEDTPRGYWPLGVVQETYPSADGIVRSVLVRTPTGKYKRPSNKLCVLEKPSSQ